MVGALAVMLTSERTARPDSPYRLTARQLEVLDGIAKRKTIKAIAYELGVSDSAVNQHIRTLKSALQAQSLSDLTKYYSENLADGETFDCRKTASRNRQVSRRPDNSEVGPRDDIGPIVTFHDALAYHQGAPWDRANGPAVVPEVLNVAEGKLARLKSIVVITLGVFAVVVLGLSAMQNVSSTLESSRPASNLKP